MYDFEYKTASNALELDSVLENFYIEDTKPKLLEIFTPSELNDETLLKYFTYIK